MVKTSIEKLAKEIGFDIGVSDDQTQGDLLNGFCEGLANSMQNDKLGTQLCYIANKLNSKSSRVLKELVEFIELKEKD